jgi:hypothetical protein
VGFGVLGMGPNPQSPIPNPQSPIPILLLLEILIKYNKIIYSKKYKFNIFKN